MRGRTRTHWSLNLNVSSVLIQNLIPGMYVSVLDDGKERTSCQEDDADYPIPVQSMPG